MMRACTSIPAPTTNPRVVLWWTRLVAMAGGSGTTDVTDCSRPVRVSQATPPFTYGRMTLEGNRNLASNGNSHAPELTLVKSVPVVEGVVPRKLKCRYSAFTSTPSPKGSLNSAIGPMMYRFVVLLKPKFGLCTVLTKSFSGTPALTPNPNGWEKAATPPAISRNHSLIGCLTVRRVSPLPGKELSGRNRTSKVRDFIPRRMG